MRILVLLLSVFLGTPAIAGKPTFVWALDVQTAPVSRNKSLGARIHIWGHVGEELKAKEQILSPRELFGWNCKYEAFQKAEPTHFEESILIVCHKGAMLVSMEAKTHVKNKKDKPAFDVDTLKLTDYKAKRGLFITATCLPD